MTPLSARKTAAILGISASTLLDRYHRGEIKAEFSSGRLIRFDPEKVRKQMKASKPTIRKGEVMIPII